MSQLILVLLTGFKSDGFVMIDCSASVLSFSPRLEIANREYDLTLPYVTTVPAFSFGCACLYPWTERLRIFALFSLICALGAVYGVDRAWNKDYTIWTSSLLPLSTAISFTFLVSSFLNSIRLYSTPYGDRVKPQRPSFLTTFTWAVYHLLFPFNFAAAIQAAYLLTTSDKKFNHEAYYVADVLLQSISSFLFLFIFREPVMYWSRFLVYLTPIYVLYVIYANAYPLPAHSGFFALDFVVLVCGYAFCIFATQFTYRYKDSAELPMYVLVQPEQQRGIA